MSLRAKSCQAEKFQVETNYVKLDYGGKHFEVAVLPGKIMQWKSGIETDIDEVLQNRTIFTSIRKMNEARVADVLSCLKVQTEEEALKIILEKGRPSLSRSERESLHANKVKEIASIVASKCIHSQTYRPLQQSMIEKAMKIIGFNVKFMKSAKPQASILIRKLQEKHYPIMPSQIKMQFIVKKESTSQVVEKLKKVVSTQDTENDNTIIIALVSPGDLRPLVQELSQTTKDLKIDILELNARPV